MSDVWTSLASSWASARPPSDGTGCRRHRGHHRRWVCCVGAWQLVPRWMLGLLDCHAPEDEREKITDILEARAADSARLPTPSAPGRPARRHLVPPSLVPGTGACRKGHDLLEEMRSRCGPPSPTAVWTPHLEPIDGGGTAAQARRRPGPARCRKRWGAAGTAEKQKSLSGDGTKVCRDARQLECPRLATSNELVERIFQVVDVQRIDSHQRRSLPQVLTTSAVRCGIAELSARSPSARPTRWKRYRPPETSCPSEPADAAAPWSTTASIRQRHQW